MVLTLMYFVSVFLYLLMSFGLSLIIIAFIYAANVQQRQKELYPRKDTPKTIYRFKDYFRETYIEKPINYILILFFSFLILYLISLIS